jgi:hypothetical protein
MYIYICVCVYPAYLVLITAEIVVPKLYLCLRVSMDLCNLNPVSLGLTVLYYSDAIRTQEQPTADAVFNILTYCQVIEYDYRRVLN